MNEILELNEKDKLKGEVYRITNNIDKTYYIGQTMSHRKNKGKYRPFGYIGRFNDHISEALNNTKKKQCTYLNNAIRKYGKEQFSVELLEICDVSSLNDREIYYIKENNSLFPNGYNLTKGGKTNKYIKVENESELRNPKKRGRNFGFVHKDSTREKMSERLTKICSSDTVKNRMSSVMKEFYDNNKVEILKKYELDNDIESYIKPVKDKNTEEIHDYVIKINGRKLTLYSKEELQEKYDRLKRILEKAKNSKGKNC